MPYNFFRLLLRIFFLLHSHTRAHTQSNESTFSPFLMCVVVVGNVAGVCCAHCVCAKSRMPVCLPCPKQPPHRVLSAGLYRWSYVGLLGRQCGRQPCAWLLLSCQWCYGVQVRPLPIYKWANHLLSGASGKDRKQRYCMQHSAAHSNEKQKKVCECCEVRSGWVRSWKHIYLQIRIQAYTYIHQYIHTNTTLI